MSRDRLELHSILVAALGSDNVYFQPPESVRMSYPCIVYNRSNVDDLRANNSVYRTMTRYTVTVMDKDPDSDIYEKLLMLKYSKYDNSFRKDNLNHDILTIYY